MCVCVCVYRHRRQHGSCEVLLLDTMYEWQITRRWLFIIWLAPAVIQSPGQVSSVVATHCNTMQCKATHCNTLQHTATHCNTLASPCGDPTTRTGFFRRGNTLQHTATHCNTLQHHPRKKEHTARLCNTMQHTATHCNTLQQHTNHQNRFVAYFLEVCTVTIVCSYVCWNCFFDVTALAVIRSTMRALHVVCSHCVHT